MRRVLIIAAIFCLLSVFSVALLLMVSMSNLRKPLDVEEGFVLEVSPGSSVNSVAANLEQRGLIASSIFLRAYARLQNKTDIKVGEYQVENTDTTLSLLDKMVNGDVIFYHLTLVEGWTFKQALAQLRSQEKLVHLLIDGDKTAEFLVELGIENNQPEGWFFPDTYRFTAGNSDIDILTRAHQRMLDTLASEWEKRDVGLPYESSYEALIMASIVEKETAVEYEREQIAGVFVRRLQKNMRLQTDPTVIYGMGDRYDGNIRRRDLSEPTPYNTYVIRGLPPTPIALPGREAIYAALHPDQSEALYFVAKGDGSHQFSETLEQHNQAVQEYQINKRSETYRSSPSPQ